jgi:hypothetical protein
MGLLKSDDERTGSCGTGAEPTLSGGSLRLKEELSNRATSALQPAAIVAIAIAAHCGVLRPKQTRRPKPVKYFMVRTSTRTIH